MKLLNKSTIAVFVLGVVFAGSMNVAKAALTGADLAAANSYFNSHPDILKYAPWIRNNVLASNTLKDANYTLLSNSYYDSMQGKVIYVNQIGGINPPVPMSTLTPSTPAQVKLTTTVPVVVSGNTAATNTKTTLNEPGLIAAPTNTTNSTSVISTPTAQPYNIPSKLPTVQVNLTNSPTLAPTPIIQAVPVATPTAVPTIKQQIPMPVNQGTPSPLIASTKITPTSLVTSPNAIPNPLPQSTLNKIPTPSANNVPTPLVALVTPQTTPPKPVIQAPVKQLVQAGIIDNGSQQVGLTASIKPTVTVVDTNIPTPSTVTPTTALKTVAPSTTTSIVTQNGKDGVDGTNGKDGVTTTVTQIQVDTATQAKVDSNSKQVAANTVAVDNVQSRQQAQETTIENHSSQLSNHEKRITALENESNNNFKNLKNDVDNNRKRAAVGVASVAAMSNIPQVTDSQSFAIGAGVGEYDSQGAVAVGFSARVTEHVVTKASVGAGSYDGATVGAGVSYGW